MQILDLDDLYPLPMDDIPSTILSVKFAGGHKKVIRSDGGEGPDRLWAFANLVEKAVSDHLRADRGGRV
jgi:hypothetical protein